MFIDLVLILIFARLMKKALGPSDASRWPVILRGLMVGAIALAILFFLYRDARQLEWISKAALITVIYVMYKYPVFKSTRSILLATVPYVAVSLLALILHDFFPASYLSWKNTFEALALFAILWGIIIWMISSKERKELARSRERILEQEEKNRIMRSMKEELEKQVNERTRELTDEKNKLEATLTDLKAAQSQLIHAEKMASLGELTAGIAHEIQNPLNFVNNFSEVNHELIEELKHEIGKGNQQAALEIADNIRDNEEKIIHHGKRADSIVKGMLMHSRSGNGQKEPVDLNALCDEYLRLAYHGLRARDKSFNASMNLDLDPSLSSDQGKIKILGQEMGRVILNLLTNAFYAVNSQSKTRQATGSEKPYKPTVTVSTKRLGDRVEIRVNDNGGGIAPENLEKIFQPFFTTKPSGQGTGLGLSLSYEIVVKAHDGRLAVITKRDGHIYCGQNGSVSEIPAEQEPRLLRDESSGTTFIISLPINE